MSGLSRLIGEKLVAHLPVILHISNAAVPQQLGNGPVVQVHLGQLHPIVVPVDMGPEAEDLTVVIPQFFLIDHVRNPELYGGIWHRPAGVLLIDEDVSCIPIFLFGVSNCLFDQRRKLCTNGLFIGLGFHLPDPDDNLAVPFRQAIRRQGQGIGYPRPQHLVDNHQPCRLRIQLYDLPVQPL